VILAQITDLHIAGEGDFPYDVDVRGRFRAVLSDIRRHSPDLLIITGDLCYREGTPGIYRWIQRQLASWECPVCLLPGNHDDTGAMAGVFELRGELHGGRLYYRRNFAGTPAYFLDTADATVSADQVDFLNRSLSAESSREVLIFMHHPPAESHVFYMDLKYPLLNREEFAGVLSGLSSNFSIFCGHYHVEKTVRTRNMTISITPSTFMQIDQEAKSFQVDHRRAGWRKIRVEAGSIMSSVRWLSEEQ
jgi:3',5'-cyclic-AMP phosphodiesterase